MAGAGGGEAKELQGAEVKRIWGLVEGGASSVDGSAWRGDWWPWRALLVARRRDARGNSERRAKACVWRTRRRARESSGADDAALVVRTDGAVANLATVTTHKDERAERATRGLDIFGQI